METTSIPNGVQLHLPVGSIQRGFNYRRRYNQKWLQELTDDVKRNGITAPVLVRCLPDGQYQLIAGERRCRAFTNAFGEQAEIPVLARDLTDSQATAMMVNENKNREDTSAIEDAEAAMRLLGLNKGDKEETARQLGWTPDLLKRRLALMNACDGVRDAFIDEKLVLGHVEILAAMRREVQEKVLDKLLAAPAMITVAQLKTMAEQVLLKLEAAIFDKAECAGCHFNTGNQQALFETSFEGTRCSNGECYNKKTEDELENRRLPLIDTYQVVRIVRPGENLTVLPLRAEGAKGVGEEQAKACRTCGDFGACVSAAPDKLGMVFKEVCFNAECNAEKVKARIEAVEATVAAAKSDSNTAPESESPTATAAPAAAAEKATGKATATTKPASSEPRNVVREYREAIWRRVFASAARKLPVEQSRALLIALCLYKPSSLDNHSASRAVAKVLKKEELAITDAFKLATQLQTLTQQELAASLQTLPAHVGGTMDIRSVIDFLNAFDIKIEQHWKINETFADLLTKTELDAVCVELGMDKAVGKEYSKLKNGSKADFIKAVMAIDGFEYVGKIPALMRWDA